MQNFRIHKQKGAAQSDAVKLFVFRSRSSKVREYCNTHTQLQAFHPQVQNLR